MTSARLTVRYPQVNVPYTESVAHRSEVLSLMFPHQTEMDLSIAYALYFAARGQGLSTEEADSSAAPVPCTTSARVLLSGLGADELFGGYSRHGAAFDQRGYAGLVDELKLDVSRLGQRNLGRDDRVMAHWGREPRFPYLAEPLVTWAMGTPAWEKCDFEHGEERTGVEAAKRVLRLLALELGMPGVAKEKKRAVSWCASCTYRTHVHADVSLTSSQIQFGARTAKMESGRVKGTTVVSRGP